jgi:hypothetical protein
MLSPCSLAAGQYTVAPCTASRLVQGQDIQAAWLSGGCGLCPNRLATCPGPAPTAQHPVRYAAAPQLCVAVRPRDPHAGRNPAGASRRAQGACFVRRVLPARVRPQSPRPSPLRRTYFYFYFQHACLLPAARCRPFAQGTATRSPNSVFTGTTCVSLQPPSNQQQSPQLHSPAFCFVATPLPPPGPRFGPQVQPDARLDQGDECSLADLGVEGQAMGAAGAEPAARGRSRPCCLRVLRPGASAEPPARVRRPRARPAASGVAAVRLRRRGWGAPRAGQPARAHGLLRRHARGPSP